jgi:putative hemolysin
MCLHNINKGIRNGEQHLQPEQRNHNQMAMNQPVKHYAVKQGQERRQSTNESGKTTICQR